LEKTNHDKQSNTRLETNLNDQVAMPIKQFERLLVQLRMQRVFHKSFDLRKIINNQIRTNKQTSNLALF
jgi:hypothetical protein